MSFTSTSLPGGNSNVEPPDPIPNSEVKRICADGSVGSPHVRVGHCQALILKTPDCLWQSGVFSLYSLGFHLEPPLAFLPRISTSFIRDILNFLRKFWKLSIPWSCSASSGQFRKPRSTLCYGVFPFGDTPCPKDIFCTEEKLGPDSGYISRSPALRDKSIKCCGQPR